MPARFRISYEDRDEEPLEGRETFFDDEAAARAWYCDDIANPDPEVGASGCGRSVTPMTNCSTARR